MLRIERTETGHQIVNGAGEVLATFDGPEEQSYYAAVAAFGQFAPNPVETADGLLPERWTSDGTPGGAISFSEALPGGRDFTQTVWSSRDPHSSLVPLMLQTENAGGHQGAELAGYVEEFHNLGVATRPGASGRFYDNEAGRQFRDLLTDGRIFGVSVDPSEAVDVEFQCTETDEFGMCVAGVDRFLAYEIAGLTGVPFPGFAQASIMLADVGGEQPVPVLAGNSDGEHTALAVRASSTSAPIAPPAEWFTLAEPLLGERFLDGLGDDVLVEQADGGLAVPLTITDDGQVFGHIARAGQCHVGDYWGAGVCASPPLSAQGYRPFHVGHVVCADGTDVATGALTVGCEHATEYDAQQVRDHYAHAGNGWADVRVVDGQWGPWACGALRPDVTDAQLRVLRALSLSGDWVQVDGSLELVGCLAVNTPGFPIARDKIAASGLQVAAPALRATAMSGVAVKLTAAGIVSRCPECQRRAAEAARAAAPARDARLDQLLEVVGQIEVRTRHLIPNEAAAIRTRLALDPAAPRP